MAVFCGKCGAPVPEGAGFCTACGAQVVQAVAPVPPAYTPAPPTPAYAPPPNAYGQTPNAYGQTPNAYGQTPNAYSQPVYGAPPVAGAPVAVKKGTSGTKIVLIVLGVLFFGAVLVVGGIYWELHRAYNKVKDEAAAAGFSSPDISTLGESSHMEACKYLSASDVGAAIGVPIIEAKSDDSGCHYIASGSADRFTMGHIKAMNGGGLPEIPGEATPAADGSSTETTSLVDVSIESRGGRTQMKVQKALLGGLGLNGNANGDVNGIGDEAFLIGNNQMVVRKGDMFIQITYSNCPCSAVQIEPLAKKLVDAL